MTKADRKPFLEIILGFAELKGKALSAPAMELYWASMQAWSLADFQIAANHLLKTCTFMPTPKDFNDLRLAGRDTAAEAWIKARQSLAWGLHGYTEKPGIDPLISKALRAIGGANVLAMTDEDELPFLERRFIEHYTDISDAEDVREALPQIAQDDRPRLASAQKRLGAA